MFRKTGLALLILLFIFSAKGFSQTEEKIVDDFIYKFTFKMPAGWEMKDMKETTDKDAISYSFESPDKKMTIMLLAFKLNSVKNIDDFIYNLEKDISLNIPSKSGDYSEQDFGKYDMKNAHYKDNKFDEMIYYFRTKLPDAPNNYVYMLRFITEAKDYSAEREKSIKDISATFVSTAE
ncbi:MAG TPA: hypothetical protein PKE39_07355 [Ignavibacteria bacterium]|nr:hypothetical protein [Ignavibacteria bacterium]HMQ98826.1 hypothetical protein [Ignavibacteria bacterium]